jgi:hypothetical protein
MGEKCARFSQTSEVWQASEVFGTHFIDEPFCFGDSGETAVIRWFKKELLRFAINLLFLPNELPLNFAIPNLFQAQGSAHSQ